MPADRVKIAGMVAVLSMAIAAPPVWAESKPASCKANKTQRQAQIAKRYAIDETYSLLTKCGLGDLLNFGLGDLGIDLNKVDMCNKPVDYLASIPANEAIKGANRGIDKGLRRPVNRSIGQARRAVKTGSWYKDAEYY